MRGWYGKLIDIHGFKKIPPVEVRSRDQLIDELQVENIKLKNIINDMNKNCISLHLHEARMNALENINLQLHNALKKHQETK